MLENVPWFLQGPDHSAAIARQLAYQATSGATGIGGTSDFRVRQTPTPSEHVQILGGSYVIKSTYASYQSYTGRSTGAVNVEIPASGSSGSKTWYVGIQVNDPEYPGTTAPAEGAENDFAYVEFVVRSSATHTKPWLPLAKIVVPANTATITNSMITDLRKVANPRRSEVVHARPRVSADNGTQSLLNARQASGGEYFPGGAGFANTFTVEVPEWATMMIVESGWLAVREDGNKSSWGRFWMEYGLEYRNHTWPNKQQWEYATQHFSWDISEKSSVGRNNWLLADTRSVPAKLRGKEITFAYKAAIADSSNAVTKAVQMDATSGLTTRVTFIEVPEGNWEDAN